MLALMLAAFSSSVPAQAVPAPDAPSLTMSAATAELNSEWLSFFISARNLAGKPVTLQVSTGAAWANVGQPRAAAGATDHFGVEHQRKTAGKYSYRAVVLSGTTVQVSSEVLTTDYVPPAGLNLDVKANTATITVTHGKGLLVRLYRVDQGQNRQLWAAESAGTQDSYTLSVPVKVTTPVRMTVQAVGFTGTKESVRSPAVTFHATVPAPPKSAVELGLTVSGQEYDAQKTFSFTGDVAAGSTVALQRHANAAWTTIWTSKPAIKGQKLPSVPYTFPAEAGTSFRAVELRNGKAVFATSAAWVTWAKLDSKLRSPTWGDMFDEAEGRVVANSSVSKTYFLDRAIADRTGYFQEYKGGAWVTLNKLTFRKSAGYPNAKPVVVSTPLTTATVTRKYRIMLPATAREKAWTSPTSTIEHVNPLHYTGYIKSSYDYMKKYCPNQIIIERGGTTSYTIAPSYRIEMARGMSGKPLQYVSLHECAHVLEFKLYKNDFGALNQRMNTVFGGDASLGMERGADCMAYAMGADPAWGGSYLRNCSSVQMAAARKVLAGQKP